MERVHPLVEWRWVDPPLFARIWKVVAQRGKRSFTVVDESAVVFIEDRPGSVCVAVDEDLEGLGFDVVPKLAGC
jgi:hypothetical protein